MKFRLLGGEHTESKWIPASIEDAQSLPGCIKDEITGDWKRMVRTSYYPGDIIETDKDLAAMFGRNKFERMPDDTPLKVGGPELRERLEGLTIPALKELAVEHQISLEGTSKKSEMIDTLLSALEPSNV